MTSLEIKRYDSVKINNNKKYEATVITTTTTPGAGGSLVDSANSHNNSNNSDDRELVREIPIIIMNDENAGGADSLDTGAAGFQFNKYGFLEPPNSHSLNNTLNKKKKNSNENLNQSSASSVSASNKSSAVAALGGDTSATSQNGSGYANMKELIQNTPVEYFAEQLPIEVVRAREVKWIDMLDNYDHWMSKRFVKLKQRCRKGIPQSMRYRAWLHLTNAVLYKKQMNAKHDENYYLKCLHNANVDSKCLDEIKRDLHRQFPLHEMFHNNNDRGANMLYNVLRAYAAHNPKVGYCQSQGPIAAVLIMHMPEEDAFWMLIRISDFYLKNYYSPDLECIQTDGETLFLLFKSLNSNAYKLMKKNSIHPTLYMTEWFMCCFARTLPWCTVLRVWDMFFCEGVKVLFRVGLYLLKCIFSNKQRFQQCLQMPSYEQQYAILSMMKDIDMNFLKEDVLVRESCKLNINEDDISSKFKKAKEEVRKTREQQQQYKQKYNNKQNN